MEEIMSETVAHPPGTFCWWELGTTDADDAKKFYGNLFGWNPNDIPIGENVFYTMLELQGKSVGALYDIKDDQPGMPAHWRSYVTVESADATAAKAKDLNGSVVVEPFDVMEHGRMAVLQDPTGAMIAAWEPKAHNGAGYVNDVGG